MSWSFRAVGTASLVAAKAREEAETPRCAEPEESIRKATLQSIATIADNTAAGIPIKAEASGSQMVDNGVVKHNQLAVHVEPIWGFLS